MNLTKRQYNIWFIIMVLFAVATTVAILFDIVVHPWHEMTQLGGDGGKNVFTFLYHILYDKGIWFTGMNYPYGEHIVYADGQPIWSVPMSYCKFLTLKEALTLMWWFIALSYALSIVFCYKILVHFRVRPWLAIVFAAFITFCAPQVLRISAHYGLAYASVIPMLFYYTLQYHSSQKKKYCFFIFLLGAFFAFMHPYYAAMILIFESCYFVAYFILEKYPLRQRLRHGIPIFLSVAGIFCWMFGIMYLTDPCKDRPTTPYGILANCTTGNQIFTSVHSPFWKFAIDKFHLQQICDGGEGYMYLGLIAIFAVITSLIIWIVKFARRKKSVTDITQPVFSNTWLLLAMFALLFSMGVPFVWGMSKLLDYATVFKQFRTLGRFSWIVYYVITIYSVVKLDGWFTILSNSKRAITGYILILFSLLVWGTEVGGCIAYIRNEMQIGYKNYDDYWQTGSPSWEQFLAEHHHKKEDFQAIISIPFFVTGSEKIWLGGESVAAAYALSMGVRAGLQLHLPMVNIMMSRTSWSLSEKQVKIAGGPFTDKPLLHDIKSEKPFLILNIDNDPLLLPDQMYLLKNSEHIGHYLCHEVYMCYPSKIRMADSLAQDTAKRILPYVQRGTDSCVGNCGIWYIQHFDYRKAPAQILGKGAFPYNFSEKVQVGDELHIINRNPQQLYEFSCWVLLSNKDYRSPYFTLEYEDSEGHQLSSVTVFTKECTDNFGLWFRANAYITLPKHCTSIRCWLHNDDHDYIAIDELMFRAADALILSKDINGKVMVNNHLMK